MSGKVFHVWNSRANACIAVDLAMACQGPASDAARET